MENTIDLLNSQDLSGEIDIITRPNLVFLLPCFSKEKGENASRNRQLEDFVEEDDEDNE